jgi:hypothetical protein
MRESRKFKTMNKVKENNKTYIRGKANAVTGRGGP